MDCKISLLAAVLSWMLAIAFEPDTVVAEDFEPRPENLTPNHTVPTREQLKKFYAEALRHGEGGRPGAAFMKVDGQFSGSTDQILFAVPINGGFDANLVRAIAMTESHWRQYHGSDCTLKRNYWPTSQDGVMPMCGGDGQAGHSCPIGECASSYGILQIKAHDFPAPGLSS